MVKSLLKSFSTLKSGLLLVFLLNLFNIAYILKRVKDKRYYIV